MREQRNSYKGSPLRPWFALTLIAADGSTKSIEVLADTGNPCALIVSPRPLDDFNSGLAPGTETNFGPLAGGWLRLQISEVGFEEDVLCYMRRTLLWKPSRQATRISQASPVCRC
jgi:hypothetical protein